MLANKYTLDVNAALCKRFTLTTLSYIFYTQKCYLSSKYDVTYYFCHSEAQSQEFNANYTGEKNYDISEFHFHIKYSYNGILYFYFVETTLSSFS